MKKENVLLNKLTVLDALPKIEQEKIKALLSIRSFDTKQVIFREGQVGDEFFFVAEGKVCISTTNADGRELLITYLYPGKFFGEISLLTGNHRSTDAISGGPTILYVLNRENFNQCLKLPKFAKLMLTYLANRLSESSARLSDLVLYSVSDNVLYTLQSLAKPSLYNGKKCLLIEERPTHQQIAALVGSSREVITRTLRDLQNQQKIIMEGKRVILLIL
jgi:CRP/FNR family transcriptional regulator, cyclic AMP receptor protein